MEFIPIYGYHRLVQNSVEGQFDFRIGDFETHLAILKEQGIKSVTNEKLTNLISSGLSTDKMVMITFDDGYASDYDAALPLLTKNDFFGTFFITVSYVNRPGYLSWDAVRELKKEGMSVQSHSFNHIFLSHLKYIEMIDELKKSKERLEEELGSSIDSIAVPGGRVSNEVIRAAKKVGYLGVYTSQPGYSNYLIDETEIYRRFILKNSISKETYLRIAQKNKLVDLKANCTYGLKRFVRYFTESKIIGVKEK